jgi:hypothetical protein
MIISGTGAKDQISYAVRVSKVLLGSCGLNEYARICLGN